MFGPTGRQDDDHQPVPELHPGHLGPGPGREHRRRPGPAQGQAPRLVRLRERHALRNFTAIQNLDYFSKLAGKRTLAKKDYAEVLERVGLQKEAFDRRSRTSPRACAKSSASPSPWSRTRRTSCSTSRPPASTRSRPRVPGDPGPDARQGQVRVHVDPRHLPGQAHRRRIGFMRKGRLVMMKTAQELAHEDLTDLYIQYMEQQPGSPAPAA